jgi:hypothetical protein
MRTIELHISSEAFQNAVANIGKQLSVAVGYLATWAVHSERYCMVMIDGDNHGNLFATYRDKDGKVTYSMAGMLRNDGTYSFHS